MQVPPGLIHVEASGSPAGDEEGRQQSWPISSIDADPELLQTVPEQQAQAL
jgi:hypothetical protein